MPKLFKSLQLEIAINVTKNEIWELFFFSSKFQTFIFKVLNLKTNKFLEKRISIMNMFLKIFKIKTPNLIIN